jgi:hypothetical protein
MRKIWYEEDWARRRAVAAEIRAEREIDPAIHRIMEAAAQRLSGDADHPADQFGRDTDSGHGLD